MRELMKVGEIENKGKMKKKLESLKIRKKKRLQRKENESFFFLVFGFVLFFCFLMLKRQTSLRIKI